MTRREGNIYETAMQERRKNMQETTSALTKQAIEEKAETVSAVSENEVAVPEEEIVEKKPDAMPRRTSKKPPIIDIEPQIERKSVHKCFILKPSVDAWLKKTAAELGISQNDFINRYLEKGMKM